MRPEILSEERRRVAAGHYLATFGGTSARLARRILKSPMVTLSKPSFAVCAVFASLAVSAFAAEEAPKLKLPETVSPTSYRAELNLDPKKETFSGHILIKVDVKQPVDTIWLNGAQLTIADAKITAGGKTLNAKALPGGNDFVGLQFESAVPQGEGEIDIHYTGQVRQQDSSGVFHMSEGGNDFLYTQFESTDARAAFPCFDEPAYKVPWQLTLTVPEQDDAVSNTPVANQATRGAEKVFEFKQTKPLPSYLIAFAVGQFDYVPAGIVAEEPRSRAYHHAQGSRLSGKIRG